MEDLNALLFKFILIAATSPAWYPFLKAVWQEFNQAMADEGGVFGRAPTPREMEDLRREQLEREDPLVHEAWPTAGERMRGRRRLNATDRNSPRS